MTRHEIRAVPALLIAGMISLAPVSAAAQTEIFRSMTNERCSEASRDAAANAARQNVESHVTRSEASIQPPTPVGDLSCLNDLMNIDIDFLSGELFSIGDIFGDLMSGLQNVTLEGLEGEVTRQICEFAAEKWSELTEPLKLSPEDLLGSISPDFTSNFSLINVAPGGTGSQTGGPVTPRPPTQSVPVQVPTPQGGTNVQVPTPQGGTNVQDTINQIYNSINGGN